MRFSLRRPRRVPRPTGLPADQVGVYGQVRRGPLRLARADLERVPVGERVVDVGGYADGESGPAVAFSFVIAAASPWPGTLYVNFEDRARSRRFSHFVSEIVDLGWIAYRAASDDGGGFRLLVPGITDGRERMDNLAWIEFSDEAV